ncbi:MAG: carbon dioxide concentrating mechanism protein CcmL [Planctomycetia bacterium]|nr:carbon dioxide concentrating mechanism protein CcmL [Planctomycetia bacterium]
MRIAETIGTVTLSKCHPSVQGATWLVAVPLTLAGLAGKRAGRGEPFVVFDELGAGGGSRIAVSEGAEAAAPFHPHTKPIDGYNAAILDSIEFEQL